MRCDFYTIRKLVGRCAEDTSRALLRILMLVHEFKITVKGSYLGLVTKNYAVYIVLPFSSRAAASCRTKALLSIPIQLLLALASCFFSVKKADFNIHSSEKGKYFGR